MQRSLLPLLQVHAAPIPTCNSDESRAAMTVRASVTGVGGGGDITAVGADIRGQRRSVQRTRPAEDARAHQRAPELGDVQQGCGDNR